MSLDKSIKYRKEKRTPYYGSKAVYASCRPHGSCKWCRNNRLYQKLKMEELCKYREKECIADTKEEMNDNYT